MTAYFKKNKLYGPFFLMGFNSLKATEPLRGGSLFFTNKFPEILDTHIIDLGKIKGCTEIALFVKANVT